MAKRKNSLSRAARAVSPAAVQVVAAKGGAISGGAERGGWTVWGAGGLLVVAIWLAYLGSFEGPFILDDRPAISENATIHDLGNWRAVLSPPAEGQTVSGRPLVNLSLAINYAIGGEAVRGYHVFNLLIHSLAALVLFGVVRRTLVRPVLGGRFGRHATWLALTAALLWALHPLATESVTYIVQRAESLAGLFYLLTLYAFIRSLEATTPWRWQVVAVAACLCGMASKEVMVSAPLLVWFYDRALGAGSFGGALRKRPWFYAALAATWVLLGALVAATGTRGATAGFGLGISPWEYAVTQCRAIIHYLRLVVWPAPLVVDYGFSVERSLAAVWPQAVLLAGLLAATGVAFWRRSAAGVAAIAFFAWLAPSSSFVPVATQTIAEHRMYLPLAAVAVLAVCGAYRWTGWRSLWVLAGAAVVLGGVTAARNEDYRSTLALWTDTAAKRPGNARAHMELGVALQEAGMSAEAVPAFEEALRLQADYPKARNNYANALVGVGRFAEARVQYGIVIRELPGRAEPWHGLGVADLGEEKWAAAAADFTEALRINPDMGNSRHNLGFALMRTGRTQEAVAVFVDLLRREPGRLDTRFVLANTLGDAGRWAEAIPYYEEIVRREPGFAGARANLGFVLARAGRTAEAVAQAEAALRIDPANAIARATLEGMRKGE